MCLAAHGRKFRPFDPDETNAIISDLAKHEHAQYANYFRAAFCDGFRPSEEIAIQWPDVDFKRRSVRIERAVVGARANDSTTTHLARDVELNQRAWDGFMAQKEYTRAAELEVFWNPTTNLPWHDIQMQWRIWRRSLCRLGIRYREPYQTRHTFATMTLMAGTNPAWIARQMGNSPQIVFKTYARWIEGADRGRERDKMDAAIADRHHNRPLARRLV